MFKKIVSRLPYSPSMIQTLGSYAGQLRQEESTRRIGLILVVVALIIQSFIVFSPPESANATDANDLISGGVRNGSQLLNHYDANTNNFQDLLTALKISRSDLVNATSNTQKLISTMNTYSWGLTPHFGADKGEVAYTVKTDRGLTRTFYYRPLQLWGNFSYSAFVGHSENVGWFAIMLNCGNLVLKTNPSSPPHFPEKASSKYTSSLVQTNTAKNLSQNNMDATTAIARPGDRITYTLSVENKSNSQESFAFQDYVADILQYADILDTSGGSLSNDTNSSFDSSPTKVLSWPATTIQPGEIQKRSFTVQIKNKIPAMAVGNSNKSSFDCKIDNAFGNTTSMRVDCPAVKIAEQTASQLPEIGLSENMIFIGITAVTVLFFYARSRQLNKEVKIIRREMSAGSL